MDTLEYRLSITPNHIKKLVEKDEGNKDSTAREAVTAKQEESISPQQSDEAGETQAATENSSEQVVPTLIERMAAKYGRILAEIKKRIAESGLKESECQIKLPDTMIMIAVLCKGRVLSTITGILDEIVGDGNYATVSLSDSPKEKPDPVWPDFPSVEPNPQRTPINYPYVIDDGKGGFRTHLGYQGADFGFGD